MRFCAIALLLFIFPFRGSGQNAVTDSLWVLLYKQKADTSKAKTLRLLSYYYKNSKPDSALILAQNAYSLSKKWHDEKGEASSLGLMAAAFNWLGNFTKALEYYLEELKIVERTGDAKSLASVYISMALVYNSQKDIDNALKYGYAADSIVRVDSLRELSLYTALDIGDIYTNAGLLDSAAAYTERCYQNSLKEKNDLLIGTALNNLGNIYFKSAEYTKANRCYKEAASYLTAKQDYFNLAECYLGLAKTYDRLNRPDYALFYARTALLLSSQNGFLKHAVNASEFLTQLYKEDNNIDSAFAVQQNYLRLKDSFDNSEKIRTMQSLTISERMRQQQMAEERLEEEIARKEKLEFFFMGAFIPILFFLSAYIARKRVNRRVIQILGVFALLFFFEYITLLLHPVVSNTAHQSPILELIIFVAIAAILLPAHHKAEHWLVAKLTSRHEKYLAGLESARSREAEKTE